MNQDSAHDRFQENTRMDHAIAQANMEATTRDILLGDTHIQLERKRGYANTKQFIEVLRGFWKAIYELDQVGREHGTEEQKLASQYTEQLVLSRDTLKSDWNNNLNPGESHVLECRDAIQCAHLGKCEIYIMESSDEEGRCAKCVEQKKIHDSWEHAR